MIEECYSFKPLNTIEGIHCFGNERDGDYFDEDDVLSWRDQRFQNAIDDPKLIDNNATRQMLYQLSKETNVIDLASGPGMGLIPSLLHLLFFQLRIQGLLQEWYQFHFLQMLLDF